MELTLLQFFLTLSIIKMKLGQMLVYLVTNISNMFFGSMVETRN